MPPPRNLIKFTPRSSDADGNETLQYANNDEISSTMSLSAFKYHSKTFNKKYRKACLEIIEMWDIPETGWLVDVNKFGDELPCIFRSFPKMGPCCHHLAALHFACRPYPGDKPRKIKSIDYSKTGVKRGHNVAGGSSTNAQLQQQQGPRGHPTNPSMTSALVIQM